MRGFNLEEALNARFRNLVVFAVTAVIFAALLQHTAHVYGGYSPADIRTCALIGVPLVAILSILTKGKASD
jgi:hypothetical protein